MSEHRLVTRTYNVIDGKGWSYGEPIELDQIDWTPYPDGEHKDRFESLDRLAALTPEVLEAYFQYNERRLTNFTLYVLHENIGEPFVVEVQGTPSFQVWHPKP